MQNGKLLVAKSTLALPPKTRTSKPLLVQRHYPAPEVFVKWRMPARHTPCRQFRN